MMMCGWRCFNGATPLRVWKVRVKQNWRKHTRELQRSHTFEGVEGSF